MLIERRSSLHMRLGSMSEVARQVGRSFDSARRVLQAADVPAHYAKPGLRSRLRSNEAERRTRRDPPLNPEEAQFQTAAGVPLGEYVITSS